MYREFDNLDSRLICELSRNSRQPLTELAKKAGVTKLTVMRRLKKFLNDGITPELVPNYSKLGHRTAALIGLSVRMNAIESVLSKLKNVSSLTYIVLTAGRYNVLLWSSCESQAKLTQLVEELSTIDGILRSETMINLKITKRPWDRLLNSAPLTKSIDALDKRIIQTLQENVRLSYARIASKLGISVPTTRNRVQRLVDDGVIAFSLSYDPLKLGYNTVTIMGLRAQPSKLQDIQRNLQQMSSVHHLAFVAGPFDLLIYKSFTAHKDLVTFLENDLGSVDGIEQVETFIVLKVVKRAYTELVTPTAGIHWTT